MRDSIAYYWALLFTAYHKAPDKFVHVYQEKCRYHEEDVC